MALVKNTIITIVLLFNTFLNSFSQKNTKLFIRDSRWGIDVKYEELTTNYFEIGKINSNIFFTMLDSMIYLKDTLIQKAEYPLNEPNFEGQLSVVFKKYDKEFIVYKKKYFSYNGSLYYMNKSIYLMYMVYIPLVYWKHATPYNLYLDNPLMNDISLGQGYLRYDDYHPRYCSKLQQWRNKRKRKKLHW